MLNTPDKNVVHSFMNNFTLHPVVDVTLPFVATCTANYKLSIAQRLIAKEFMLLLLSVDMQRPDNATSAAVNGNRGSATLSSS